MSGSTRPLTATAAAACAVALAAVAAPVQAAANPQVERTVREAGLLGDWAQDCSRPAAEDNWWRFNSVDPAGDVVSYAVNGDAKQVTRFTAARRLANGDIATTVVYLEDGEVVDVTYRLQGGLLFPWTSVVPATGDVYVKDGLIPDGTPIMRLKRCPDARPAT